MNLMYDNYLLKCDYLNKNNQKNIFSYPFIRTIILNCSIKSFEKSLKKNQTYKDLQINEYNKIISFYIYIIYLNKFSYIKYKEYALLKSKIISFHNISYEYSLKSLLRTKKDVHKFIIYSIIQNLPIVVKKKKKTINQYSIDLSISNVLNIKNFFEKIIDNFEIENLIFRTTFSIKHFKKFKNLRHLLKNCSFV